MIGYLFTYLLLAIGTSFGWIRPFVGLMVYWCFAVLRPPFLWFWAFDYYNHPRLSFYVGMSTLAGWAMLGMGDWKGLKGARLAITGLVGYVVIGVLTTNAYSVWPDYSWGVLDTQIKIALMALVTMTIVRDPRRIMIFCWVLLASLGYLAYTLNEWYRINPMYLHNNGFGAIDNNGVGMIMVMIVPLAFFMGVYDKRWWVRLLCFFSAACAIHVILFSFSRGSQLGLCMVGAFIFLWAMLKLPRKMLTFSLALIFVGITLRLAGDGVRERFMSIFAEDLDASAESRFSTWRAAWECIKEHPLGVGPRNFGAYATQYGLSAGKAVHNLYLQTGADYGIPGLICLMMFYGSTFVNTFRMGFNPVARRLVWPFFISVAVCTSLGGFLVCSTFIGMESVEVGFMISLLGLVSVAYVNRVSAANPIEALNAIPELKDVPLKSGNDEGEPWPERQGARPAWS
ncbi:MAG: O-antigen ligase family protein [Phycisphaeraceae bacterium]